MCVGRPSCHIRPHFSIGRSALIDGPVSGVSRRPAVDILTPEHVEVHLFVNRSTVGVLDQVMDLESGVVPVPVALVVDR